jgi:hypothetical protein
MRAIEREVDSALRLLSEIYTELIRKYNGVCLWPEIGLVGESVA